MGQVVRSPDGRNLAVDILGDPCGESVFLMHGTPGSLRGPRPRQIFLYRLGIRLISYNRPGYPGSNRVKDRKVADAVNDVVAIADHFGIDRFSVIGRSGGAPHALACAADERLQGRLVCTAALSSLAPYDAGGLDWYADMADSNVRAYKNAESNLHALIATFNEWAQQVRNSSQGLIDRLRLELADSDEQVIGDVALRRMIADTHADALSESIDGWVDDVRALSLPWGFDLADIGAPVLLWHGGNDAFSPTSHTRWLAEQIPGAELDLRSGAAHFEALKVLPEILHWILDQGSKPSAIPGLSPLVPSERLWSDYAEQPASAAGPGDVRMLRSELIR